MAHRNVLFSARMNIRHAAALTLVGCYPMVPIRGNDPIPNPVITFSNWVNIRSFDSAERCEDGRLGVIQTGIGGPQLMGYPETEVKKVLLLSQCVASDDPRLAR
jgi:hypothetical protein